ncbi:hypothetical protein ABIE77_003514 [Sinorhizobium fredii]
MALFAVEIPEDHRELLEFIGREADLLGALDKEVLRLADRPDAGQIALHVGAEDRNAGVREALGKDLQRHGLAGAGGAGDQAMAVAELQFQIFRLVDRIVRLAAGPDIELAFLQHGIPLRRIDFVNGTGHLPNIVQSPSSIYCSVLL